MGKLLSLNLTDVNSPINLCIYADFLFTSCPSCSWQLQLCSCQGRLYVWLLHICPTFRASIHFMVRLVIGCCWTCSWMIWRENLDSALGDRLQLQHKWIFRSWACRGQPLCCFWNRKLMAILLERPLNDFQAEWRSSKLCSAESSSSRSHNRCPPIRPQVLCEPLCHLIFTVGSNIPLWV